MPQRDAQEPETRTPPADTDGARKIGLTAIQVATFAVALQCGLRDLDAEACAAGLLLRLPTTLDTHGVVADLFTGYEARRIVEAVLALRTRGVPITVSAVSAETGFSRALLLELSDPVSDHRWSAEFAALVERLRDLQRRRHVLTIGLAALEAAHAAADIVDGAEQLRDLLDEVAG